jgi:hypothetical protein
MVDDGGWFLVFEWGLGQRRFQGHRDRAGFYIWCKGDKAMGIWLGYPADNEISGMG